MKKILVLVTLLTTMLSGLTGCGATKTTEYKDYNSKTGKYELTRIKEEDVEGIFDENIEIQFGEVQIETVY